MRIGRRIVAGLLAALIAAAGVIAVIEIIAAAAGGGHVLVDWRSWADGLSDTARSEGPALLAAGFVALVGLLLIGTSLRRGTPARLRTRWDCPRAGVFVNRRGLARDLRATALAVDGVERARVRVDRRVADVRLRLRPRTAGGAPQRVGALLRQELDAFALVEPSDLIVRAATPTAGRRHKLAGGDGPARHDGPAERGGPGGYAGPSEHDGRAGPGGPVGPEPEGPAEWDGPTGGDGPPAGDDGRARSDGPGGCGGPGGSRVGAAARRGGEAP
ncbi:DUF6286 domain-containing protein [Frankia sp. QA3]|uniref:DUF6286 domain-containing protein n=1 Tax=Frankia sp. QA3 TaxID=710111 RepID=UPI000269CC38|nr:DUF6286 domain-containing protein [Frankia sp. QA3]EIV95552.1 hypothetical protein FraQA3DRAFT_5390 [Frankia sp. QA3]